MGFERGQLYWLPKNGTIVEYIGAAAGGQQNVKEKESGNPLTVKTDELKPLDEAAYNRFLEEFKSQGLNMTDIWNMDESYRGVVQGRIQNIFPDFTLESEQQFEDWRDDMFDMHNRAPPVVTEASKDNTMYWVIGGILALVLVNYK